MNIHTKAKTKVLEDLIEMMDEKMLGDMKPKSPKFMKVETNDPEMAKDVVEGALDSELSHEDEEKVQAETEQEAQSTPEDDEDLQKLLEMYQKLK